MARWLTLLFVAVLAVVALFPVRGYLTRDREVITSTPSAYTGTTVPVRVPAGGEGCADEILFDERTEIARFSATAPRGRPGPPLRVYAYGEEGQSYRSEARIPGGWRGTRQFEARLDPPDRPTFGTFCVISQGGPVALVGTKNDRTLARPVVRVNSVAVPEELTLTLLEDRRASLLERAPEVLRHAATVMPLGAWWWWLLVVAVVTLVPLGVLGAVRAAIAADRVDEAPWTAPARGDWPSAAARERFSRVPGRALVAGAALVALAYYAYWGLSTHVFQNDENQYVYLSRWLWTDFPSSLWDFDVYQRGLQRLEVWLLAVPNLVFDGPGALAAGRVLNTMAFVSTAVPVFLLGRRLGLSSRWAALPAVLSIAVPWAVVTTAFLTENLAYPVFAWIVWAVWRTAADPSPGRDLLALALLLAGGMTRSAMLLLVALLPLVVLAVDLRFATGGAAARLSATVRRHVVLWGAVALGVLALALGAVGLDPTGGLVDRLSGVYGTPFGVHVPTLAEKIAQFFSRSVVGTGFLAAAVALPWLVLQLARPRSPERFAFAVTVLGAMAITLYTVNSAGFDERYIVYLAPLLFVPATVAVARRELWPAGIAAASLLLGVLLARVSWNPEPGAFGFFVSPAETFYARAVVARLDVSLPGGRETVEVLVPLVLAIAGVALAAALHRVPGRVGGRAAVAGIGAVALAVAVQTHYTISKHVEGAGAKAGPSLSERGFADEHTPSGSSIALFIEGAGRTSEFTGTWKEIQFYNRRIDTVASFGPNVQDVPAGDDLVDGIDIDARTGRLRTGRPVPEHLVVPSALGEVRVRGEVLASPEYVAVNLIRAARPLTAAWYLVRPLGEGATIADGGSTVRVYGTGLRPGAHCAALDLGVRDARPEPARFSVRVGGRRDERGRLTGRERERVTVDLPRLVERGYVDVELRGTAQLLAVYVDDEC